MPSEPQDEQTEERGTGTLYIVATPIGNLEDVTLRAIKVLSKVHLIAAEDTRRTSHLLSRYFITCPLMPYHDHNKKFQAEKIVQRLLAGDDVALVTDAGAPAVADPAYYLVRQATASDIAVIPLPGPSAVIAALMISGLPTDRFTFYGFVPRKSGRREALFIEIGQRQETAVLFETPHRIQHTLRILADILPRHRCLLCREMTKLHEQYIRASTTELAEIVATMTLKGELTLVISVPETEPEPEHDDLPSHDENDDVSDIDAGKRQYLQRTKKRTRKNRSTT